MAAKLRLALPAFTALYEEHVALEKTVVYRAARELHAQLKAAGGERRSGG